MALDLMDRIEMMKKHATKQEHVIIVFLLANNFSDLVYLSITEFSEKIGVSDATTLRFCRKLGLKGFSEFRLLLATSSTENATAVTENYAYVIAEHMCSAIRSTYELVDFEEVNKAVKFLREGSQIYSIGSGNSGIAAAEFRNKLMRIGVHVNNIVDQHFQAIMLSTITKDDVVVIFSVTGATIDMIEIAEMVHVIGAKIIVITSYKKSPLAKSADCVLNVVSRDAPLDAGSLVTKASQLYIINILSTALFQAMGIEAQENLSITAQAVLKKNL